MKCQQCGFDHTGWAFEADYEKICVKCGTKLEGVEEVDSETDHPADNRPAIFSRMFNTLFKKKKGKNTEGNEEAYRIAAALETGRLEDSRLVEQERARAEELSSCEGAILSEPGIPERKPREKPKPAQEPAGAGKQDQENLIACKESAHLLWKKGCHEEAVDLYRKAIEIEPNDPEAWGELGRIYYDGLKDYPKSIEFSRMALSLDDGLIWIHCNLCLALLQEGQFDAAKKGFLKIIRLIQETKDSGEVYRENMQALLHDCLGQLYSAKKEASGNLRAEISDIIELLELEKIYFH